MPVFRFTANIRQFATLLVFALVACADDTLTTPPASGPADTPVGTPAASLTAADTGEYRWATLLFNPIVRSGVGAAAASALPYSGIYCFDEGNGYLEYQLTIGPLRASLSTAKTALIEWSMRERHLPNGGHTSVYSNAQVSTTMGGPLTTFPEDTTEATTFQQEVVNYATRRLEPAELSTLQTAGGTLFVRIETGATARVREEACGKEIASAFAAITVYNPPRLMVAY